MTSESARKPVAVVTGGAGGIGAAICQRLAADGTTVIVGYNSNSGRATELAERLPGQGHRTVAMPVTDSQGLTTAAQDVIDRNGPVDVLVNCAGMTKPVPHENLEALTDDVIDRIFAVNVRGAFATIRAFEKALRTAKSPVIINISSVAGVTGQGSNVAYCASKAALDSMTRSLARALAPQIRVLSVSPGWVRGEYADRLAPELLAVQENATPLRRLANPEEVAAAVSAAAFALTCTTGTTIPVDGGRPLGTN